MFCALYADRVPEKTIRQVIKGRPAGIIIKAAGKQDSGREVFIYERNKLAGHCRRYAL